MVTSLVFVHPQLALPPSLIPSFSHCSELFGPSPKSISRLFKQIRTLCAKHPGWHTPGSANLPIGPPAQPLPLPSTFDSQLSTLPRPRPISPLSPFVSHSLHTPSNNPFALIFFQKTPGGRVLALQLDRTLHFRFIPGHFFASRNTDQVSPLAARCFLARRPHPKPHPRSPIRLAPLSRFHGSRNTGHGSRSCAT
jgi:hypothetical protein